MGLLKKVCDIIVEVEVYGPEQQCWSPASDILSEKTSVNGVLDHRTPHSIISGLSESSPEIFVLLGSERHRDDKVSCLRHGSTQNTMNQPDLNPDTLDPQSS